MFNELTCKVRYEWVNAIRASSFIENVPQINAKPIAFQRNLLGKLPRNRPFFLPIIFQRNWPQKSRKFPAKSAIFFVNLTLKIPRNSTFFHDLPEALYIVWGGGAGLDFLALLAFFSSVISSFFAQHKGGGGGGWAPPLDPPLTRIHVCLQMYLPTSVKCTLRKTKKRKKIIRKKVLLLTNIGTFLLNHVEHTDKKRMVNASSLHEPNLKFIINQ